MTEQDAPTGSDDEAADDGPTVEDPSAESTVDADAADTRDEAADAGGTEDLADIAGEPEGDVDRALSEIAAAAVETEDLDLEAVLSGEGDLEAAFEPGDLEVDEALVERIAEADPAAVAREIATLQLRIAALEGEQAELESEIDDLESRLARKQADFQNYKQRQQRKLEEEKERATQALVERLLDVRDNLDRALEQEEGADIRGGVESTLRQFDAELDRENVERIEPTPGQETDPHRHEVLMRVDSDQPEGTVADVHRPGYEMAGTVLRPAQVTVSEGSAEGDGETADDADEN